MIENLKKKDSCAVLFYLTSEVQEVLEKLIPVI